MMAWTQTSLAQLFIRIWKAWERFWFQPMDPLPFALFRFAFGLNLLVMYGWRHLYLERFYTDAGVLSAATALQVLPDFFRPALALHPLISSHPFLWHGLFLVLLLLLTLGIGGRIVAAGSLLLHLAFMHRNISVVYGADIVTTFWLFYLTIGGAGTSVGRGSWISNSLHTVGVRLVQIQLCVIYGYTGLEKLKGAPWWDGTAIWAVVNNNQLMLVDVSWLKGWPFLLGIMAHTAVLFEVYFPILVWLRPLRKWLLLYGVLMHVAIGAGMGLFFFSGAMISAYCVFLSAAEARMLLGYLPRSRFFEN